VSKECKHIEIDLWPIGLAIVLGLSMLFGRGCDGDKPSVFETYLQYKYDQSQTDKRWKY
tara:strand:+ start:67 stop:243 length:177 start_codon:yes stop_codon:yes gene_type:complete